MLVENCSFDVGDDAICLKSGKDKAGREFGKPSEYISVRNCVVHNGHGGIVVGSEMSGSVRNVHVSGCMFLGTDIGIRFKSCRGRGGVVENIVIEKIRMHDIAGDAISFNMYYEGKSGSGEFGGDQEEAVSEETPVFRHIRLEEISCRGARKALIVNGLPEMPIHDLIVNNVVITSDEGMVCRHASQLQLANLQLFAKRGPVGQFHQCRSVRLLRALLSAQNQALGTVEISGEHTTSFEYADLQQTVEFQLKDGVSEEVLVR